jgi:hypothetical protein
MLMEISLSISPLNDFNQWSITCVPLRVWPRTLLPLTLHFLKPKDDHFIHPNGQVLRNGTWGISIISFQSEWRVCGIIIAPELHDNRQMIFGDNCSSALCRKRKH